MSSVFGAPVFAAKTGPNTAALGAAYRAAHGHACSAAGVFVSYSPLLSGLVLRRRCFVALVQVPFASIFPAESGTESLVSFTVCQFGVLLLVPADEGSFFQLVASPRAEDSEVYSKMLPVYARLEKQVRGLAACCCLAFVLLPTNLCSQVVEAASASVVRQTYV